MDMKMFYFTALLVYVINFVRVGDTKAQPASYSPCESQQTETTAEIITDENCVFETNLTEYEEQSQKKDPIIEETLVEFVEDKGAPNPETVAGDEQVIEQGAVLGASTSTVVGASNTLAATGVGVGLFSVVGFGIIFVTVFLRQQEKH